jgi:arylformamidase
MRDQVESNTNEDMRVQFDFEIDFANGGGIQGQGFRLDIEGQAITDHELAAHLITDMRLLMVTETRILGKKIIRETHKRRSNSVQSQEPTGRRTLIDLSHTIEDGMITYKGLPAPLICDFLSHKDSRTAYAPGTEFQIGRIEMCSNTGTYVDSPYHRYADGVDLSQLSLAQLAELDAIVVDVIGGNARAIGVAQLLPYEICGKAVLIRTGWDRHWRRDASFEHHPHLTAGAAEYLVQQAATLVGIDSLNIDDTDDPTRPVHSQLLAAGIPICEHLTNLSALPADGFRFTAVPVKVRGMGTFPVRAYATIEQSKPVE